MTDRGAMELCGQHVEQSHCVTTLIRACSRARQVARLVRRAGGDDCEVTVSFFRSNVLLCDEERNVTDVLAADLRDLGHAVTIARSCADTFAAACTYDFDALIVAPYLRDGSALVLPGALGIRRPRLVVLACRLRERLATSVSRRVGFDIQLTKLIDPRRLDRLLRASIADAAAEALAAASVMTPELERVDQPPASEVGARGPR